MWTGKAMGSLTPSYLTPPCLGLHPYIPIPSNSTYADAVLLSLCASNPIPPQDTPHKPTFPHLGASFHSILPLSDFIPPHLTQHRPFNLIIFRPRFVHLTSSTSTRPILLLQPNIMPSLQLCSSHRPSP